MCKRGVKVLMRSCGKSYTTREFLKDFDGTSPSGFMLEDMISEICDITWQCFLLIHFYSAFQPGS
jgi:hypothetical protein